MRNVSIHNLFRNQTGGFEPRGWQPEPEVRGTWSILSSCVITMLLCVWTAVHLNIPNHLGSGSQSVRKIGWLLLGLIAPEMIAFTAWHQHREAVKLTQEMRKALGQSPPSTLSQRVKKRFHAAVNDSMAFFVELGDLPAQAIRGLRGANSYLVPSKKIKKVEHMGHSDVAKLIRTYNLEKAPPVPHEQPLPPSIEPRYMPSSPALAVQRPAQSAVARHKWTMIHSLYAIMGGFTFSSEGLHINFLRDAPQRVTITPEGLVLLAKWEPEVLPDVSIEDIQDKSKADGLKKLIVCLQAGRFLVSTIFRMAVGYPIALLELTTVAHCIYALLVYIFWWSKPLDVSEPTVIPARLCPELVAVFSMASEGHGGTDAELTVLEHHTSSDIAWLVEMDHRDTFQKLRERHRLYRQLELDASLSARYFFLDSRDLLFGFKIYTSDQAWALLSHADVERWRLASLAARKYLDDEGRSCVHAVGGLRRSKRYPNLVADRAYNWPSDFMTKWDSFYAKTIVLFWGPFILAGLSYGGIHLLAWNAPLRHPIEVDLWILSGISIGVAAPVMAVSVWIVGIFTLSTLRNRTWWFSAIKHALNLVVLLFFFSCFSLYVFARVFLIVECFINLFYVDAHVFQVPRWTQYVPSLQ